MEQQQQERDTPAEVLQLLLQQPAMCSSANTSAVIKLLAVSNATRTAVTTVCAGRLSLSFSTQPNESHLFKKRQRKEKRFAIWLSRHGYLLKSLHIHNPTLGFEQHLAKALRIAGASPNGLHLQSFDSDEDFANSVKVLRLLPAHSLTHLRICLTEPYIPGDMWGCGYGECECDCDYEEYDEFGGCACDMEMELQMAEAEDDERLELLTKHDNARMVKTLAALPNLSSLAIHGHETLLFNSPVVRGLSKLTALTKFYINKVLPDYSMLSRLPGQLRELEVDGVDRWSCNNSLALGHLTALTRMHLSAVVTQVCVGGKDVLPPNLVSLCVTKIDGPLQLLVQLKSLRRLTLAQLPLLNQLPGHTSASTTNSSNAPTATLEQVQACLPDVAIKLSEGRRGKDFACHCCSGGSV